MKCRNCNGEDTKKHQTGDSSFNIYICKTCDYGTTEWIISDCGGCYEHPKLVEDLDLYDFTVRSAQVKCKCGISGPDCQFEKEAVSGWNDIHKELVAEYEE